MTTLNTKNGQLLVKDGKLQTDCGCCGGWYCCGDRICLTDALSSVAVTISGQDFLRHRRTYVPQTDVTLYESFGFGGAALNGTHYLAQTNDTQYSIDGLNGNRFSPKNPNSEWVATIGNSNAFQCGIQLSAARYTDAVWRWSMLLTIATCVYATTQQDYKTLDYLGGVDGLTVSPSPYSPVAGSTFARRRNNFIFVYNTIDQCGTFAPLEPRSIPIGAAEAWYSFYASDPAVITTDFQSGQFDLTLAVSFS
jgi:hypothetical protein